MHVLFENIVFGVEKRKKCWFYMKEFWREFVNLLHTFVEAIILHAFPKVYIFCEKMLFSKFLLFFRVSWPLRKFSCDHILQTWHTFVEAIILHAFPKVYFLWENVIFKVSVIFSGYLDHQGSLVVIIFCKHDGWDSPNFNTTELAKLLLYYNTLPR